MLQLSKKHTSVFLFYNILLKVILNRRTGEEGGVGMLRDEEEMERCAGRDGVGRMLSLMSTLNMHTLPSGLAPGLCRTLG